LYLSGGWAGQKRLTLDRFREKGEFAMKRRISILAALALCLSLTASAQLNNPNNIVFDSSGNLWVANYGTSNVVELLEDSNWALGNTITNGVNAPTRMFFLGSDLYVVNTGGNSITEYDDLSTPGATLVQTIDTGAYVSRSLGAALDAYGDLYVSGSDTNNIVALNIGGGKIENLTQDKSGFPFTAPGPLVINGQNIYVGFGPGGSPNAVISYNVGEFLTRDPKEIVKYNDGVNTGPTGIAFDKSGNVYIAEYYSSTWVKYAPNNGTVPVCVVSSHVQSPEGIAIAKNGRIYVSNSAANNITWYTPACAYGGTID
jgi:sugar lactone lactonase YvrE